MIIVNFNVFEINDVISSSNDYWVLCAPYNITKFNPFYNSIEIEINRCNATLFKISELENIKTYEKKSLNGITHLLADTLDVFRDF